MGGTGFSKGSTTESTPMDGVTLLEAKHKLKDDKLCGLGNRCVDP